MTCQRIFSLAVLAAALGGGAALFAASPENAGQALAIAAQSNKFCFLLFYRTNDPATQAAAKTLSDGVAKRAERATFGYVNIADPKEQAIVKQFDVARTAMPFMLAIAPNGAITCVYAKPFSDTELDKAFVTPGMTRVMKQIQSGNIVLLCVQPGEVTQIPAGVTQFMADAKFRERSAVLQISMKDPHEERFLRDLKIDPIKTFETTVVFLAPPGVMVGKYGAAVTKAQLGAELHAAGKCCDDPNCKHNHKH